MSERSGVFPARMDAFPHVVAFIEEVCAAAEFDRRDCLRFTLVVEELFTNTVRHGHRRDSDEPVSLTFEIQNGRIALTYEDTAPPYDPFSAVKVTQDPVGGGEGSEGGLGVVLIANIAREIEYSYAHGRNRIVVVVGQRCA